jgi:hypothetical protein
MRNFPRIASSGVLFLTYGLLLLAHQICAQVVIDQSTAETGYPKQIKYFSLEHRAADLIDGADRELLHARKKELISEAQFYGYDITTSGWTYDQTICPQLPNTLLLHYLNKFPDGSESLFTAVIPRGTGRVRIVPVLYRNSSPYSPAVKNPRNFAIFNALVSDEIAKKDSGPEGNWLSLGVCYAEMVGARPNVPDDPSLDTATIKAPVATYRYDTATKQKQVQFSDRDSPKLFKIWTISLNENGRVTGAMNEDYATYVAHIVQPPAPPGTAAPPSSPPSRVIPEPPQPPSAITPAPPRSMK